MKRYIVILATLMILVSVVIYYVLRWNEISKITKDFSKIENGSYRLELLNQNQKLLLSNLRTNNNYDEITLSSKKLDNSISELITMLVNTKEDTLIKLADEIGVKRTKLSYIYEDIKTDSAEMKNSIHWLSKSYRKYLGYAGTKDYVDVDMMIYMFDILNTINKSDIYSKMESYEHKKINLKIDRLDKHIELLHYEYSRLVSLHGELTKSDINPSLKQINRYVQNILDELRSETSYIVQSLLVSSIFLILFGLFVYVKEIIARSEAYRLKNELQQFVDALNESAIVSKTDKDGVIIYVNDKFCEVSGYQEAELLGQNHNIIRHPDMSSELFKELWKSIKNKKVFKATIKNCTKDGGAYWVDTVVIPLLDVDGEIYEYLAVRYDVTELIDSRNKAISAEKAKNEFLSNMSHELRTPLNAINGFSGILKRHLKDETHIGYALNILESSDHLIGLINDILDLSKLQSGKFVLDTQDFYADEKIRFFLHRFDTQLDMAELSINLDLNDTLKTTLHGDWLRISQIMTNLISNAIKFTPKGKDINFTASYQDSSLIFSVKDNGIGMSSEVQEKIFKPFEQADSSISRKFGGTGLGLSIVSNLVEQMRGTINLLSKEGEGTTFEVSIPLLNVFIFENKDVQKVEENVKENLSGHVLIAEDNKTNQILIGILVEDFGLTYDIVNDGTEAVEQFEKGKYDLVLMDENMPNLNGIGAMKEIHEKYGNTTPIIALTANVMSGDKEKFLKAGMNGYIAKPVDNDELYKILKYFLSQKA